MNDNIDNGLISKVKEALQKQAQDIKSADIFVSVLNGEVILKGVVDTPQERDKALEIARKVEGVQSVQSEMKVMSERDKTDPSLQNTPHPGYENPGDDQGCAPSGRVG